MARVNINLQNMLCVRLLRVRRHFGNCTACRAAYRGNAFDAMCDWTKMELCGIASRWDGNINGRLKAGRSGAMYFYPCPDLNRHGPAYAVVAEAMIAESVQDRLM